MQAGTVSQLQGATGNLAGVCQYVMHVGIRTWTARPVSGMQTVNRAGLKQMGRQVG